VRKYGRLVQYSKNSLELHHVRRDRFGHLPNWHNLAEETKQHILTLEEHQAKEHKEWEDWRAEHNPKHARPDAVTLPGDKSGLQQMVMFKGISYTGIYLLRKSRTGLTLTAAIDKNGKQVHRWKKSGHTYIYGDWSVSGSQTPTGGVKWTGRNKAGDKTFTASTLSEVKLHIEGLHGAKRPGIDVRPNGKVFIDGIDRGHQVTGFGKGKKKTIILVDKDANVLYQAKHKSSIVEWVKGNIQPEDTPTAVAITIPDHMQSMDDTTFIAAAKQYAKEHYSGKTVTNQDDGSTILIPWQGIKHAFSRYTSRAAATAALNLGEIIESAKKIETERDTRDRRNIHGVHIYQAMAIIGGEQTPIKIFAREHDDGKRYYDHYETEHPAGQSGELAKSQGSLQPCTGCLVLIDYKISQPVDTFKQVKPPGQNDEVPAHQRLYFDPNSPDYVGLIVQKSMQHIFLLRKSQIANRPGYILRNVTDSNGIITRRWFRADLPGIADPETPAAPTRGELAQEMRGVLVPTFDESASETNRMTARRTRQLWQYAMDGDIDAIASFSTSRTRANYSRVDDYKQALLAAANRRREIPPVHPTLGPAPEPTTIRAGNMLNSALLSAQAKINRLHEAAVSELPVAAILRIETTRSNGYTRAADDYRTQLLRHFGHNSDGTEIAAFTPEAAPPMPAAPVVAPEIARTPATPRRRTPPRPTVTAPPVNPVPGSANPLNLTETQLGFVPRPNMPISYYTGLHGYYENRNQEGAMHTYPTPEMKALARRYLAQSGDLQNRARAYQEGTWVPDTPEARAQRDAANAAARVQSEAAARVENERVRQFTAQLQDKLAASGFKARNIPGANITSWSGFDFLPDDMRKVAYVTGLDTAAAVKHAIGTMLADYGGRTTFRVELRSRQRIQGHFPRQ